MRARALCVSLVGSLVLIAPVVRAIGQQPANRAVAVLLEQADKAIKEHRNDEATKRVDEALALAQQVGDRVGLAMSYRLKGVVTINAGRAKESIPWYLRSIEEFERLGHNPGLAAALADLVTSRIELGDTKEVRAVADRAMTLFKSLGDDRGQSLVLSQLVRSNVAPDMEDRWIQQLLEIATRLSDDRWIGEAHVLRASREFSRADYAAAKTSYEQAIAALERSRDTDDIAAAYLSLGRVYRAHGDYEGAIVRYQKAIDLLAPTADRYTIVEAINAKALALRYLNRHKESLIVFEQGIALARESGNQRVIDFIEVNYASGLIEAGEFERAIPLLQAAIDKKPEPYQLRYRYNALANALASAGRAAEAVAPNAEAVAIAREVAEPDILAIFLDNRAWILSLVGRYDEALTASLESSSLIEQVRTKLVPTDYLKRGFADRSVRYTARAVNMLGQLGRAAESLEYAERGRARAFLDLLAVRESETGAAAGTDADRLVSNAIGQPLDAAGTAEVAKRLNAAIIEYWVNDDSIFIWVTRADQQPGLTRVPFKHDKLAALVAATTAALRPAPSAAGTRGAEEHDLINLPMRSVGIAALAKDDKSSWRELYKTLIEPVRAQLPSRGGRIVLVPHGPLFQLSFAGLQSGSGRYLIEDYELSYAPSSSVLALTDRRQRAVAANRDGPWAIVGSPAMLPMVNARPLPPLPGAAREIASIAAIAPKGKALRFDGAGADESAVVRALASASPSVLHFATHGLVFSDPKQSPFLALNRRGDAAADDGRLTLDEVYGLRLSTDLVVLSACRTGSGQVSSDGVIGLTRGFFYAGSPSVLATFWDVTDEATVSLMSGFYRRYVKTHAKSASLRQAQLALLADLRAGKVVVTASGRRVTLPEHPLLWAAFFLSGEP